MAERRMIATHLVREPRDPVRSEMDPDYLESLAASMRQLGVLEALIVSPLEDGTFEVIAGHRRLLAARRAPLLDIPCDVETDAEKIHAIRIHENAEREDMAVVDEARYYERLLPLLGNDTDRVAAAVKRTREYVESRLILLRGDAAVLDALRARKITLGVANEINRMTREQDRAYFLENAVRGGCSIRQARLWREMANAQASYMDTADTGAAAAAGTGGPAGPEARPGSRYAIVAKPYELSTNLEPRPCLFCAEQSPEWTMVRKFICGRCADEKLLPLEQALEGRDGQS